MSPVSHQTIKLSPGKHYSPDDGACVMELSSMLAGGPFTDHPASVCPVIGSVMRAYNDFVDDEGRQDLYAYAARVVGSRADAEVEQARSERAAEWSAEMRLCSLRRFLPLSIARALSRMKAPRLDSVGTYAVRVIPRHTVETHTAVLGLVDDLLAINAHNPCVRAAPTVRAAGDEPRGVPANTG
ncbi:MAG TPA: hypothetical protein VGF93_16895 [Solirubrobacteraceae bacterium]